VSASITGVKAVVAPLGGAEGGEPYPKAGFSLKALSIIKYRYYRG